MSIILEIALWSAAALWTLLLLGVLILRRYRQAPRPLRDDLTDGDKQGPLVSILVPARNEEHRVLREAIGSMLAQDYPHLEVIVVNDRSTDRTQEILEELAARDRRLRVIQGQEPPPGWLGKPFALHQALAHARGEWILSIDADILLHPKTVRTTLARAREYGCDALSLLPRMDYVSFWDHVIEPHALNLLRLGMLVGSAKARMQRREWQKVVRRWPQRSATRGIAFHPLSFLNAYVADQAFTIGAFTLVRREALEAVGGYASICSEVMDETILGMRMHRQGYRVFAVEGTHLIHTPARVRFTELWQAYSRVICPAMGRNPFVLLGTVVAAFVIALLPVLSLALTAIGWLSGNGPDYLLAASVAYAAMVATGMILSEEDPYPKVYHLASFVGFSVFMAIAVASVWRRYRGQDVIWKGRPVYLSVMTEPQRRAQDEM
jgi:chlorobactene glucosyltransferase